MGEGDKLLNREPESVEKENWVDEKAQDTILKTLDSTVEEQILAIDNEIVRNTLSNCLHEKILKPEAVLEQCRIYKDNIKPRLENEEMMESFNKILSINSKLLPSRLLIELQNVEAIKLMERSLKHIFPSVIAEFYDTFIKFSKVEDLDAKKIIYRYIDKWFTPDAVDEMYEDYVNIRDYNYKNQELKSFLLSLIEENNVNASLIAYYFSIIKDKADFWEDDKEYILKLINTPWF